METIRPNSQQAAGGQQAPSKQPHRASAQSKLLVIGLIFIGLALAAALSVAAFTGPDARIKADQYQAVFLEDGQVFFGSLDKINETYVELSNVYYLSSTDTGLQTGESNSQLDPGTNLVKLGDEAHGPESVMYISAAKILYWENLSNDSPVVTAITNGVSESSSEILPAEDDTATDETTPADDETTTEDADAGTDTSTDESVDETADEPVTTQP